MIVEWTGPPNPVVGPGTVFVWKTSAASAAVGLAPPWDLGLRVRGTAVLMRSRETRVEIGARRTRLVLRRRYTVVRLKGWKTTLVWRRIP